MAVIVRHQEHNFKLIGQFCIFKAVILAGKTAPEISRAEMSASKITKLLVLMSISGAALSGCTQTSRFGGNSSQPAPLTPTPVGVVEAKELEPAQPGDQLTPDQTITDATDTTLEPEIKVAAAPPPADGGKAVTREALVGAWQVDTGGSRCQLFLSLTKWSGGYRAASRGCAAAALSDVQAWDVKGKQIVLVNSNGGTAARLYRSAGTRYDGSTSSGSAISFSR